MLPNVLQPQNSPRSKIVPNVSGIEFDKPIIVEASVHVCLHIHSSICSHSLFCNRVHCVIVRKTVQPWLQGQSRAPEAYKCNGF